MKPLSEPNFTKHVKVLSFVSLVAFLGLLIVWSTPDLLRLRIAVDEKSRAADSNQIIIVVSLVNNLHHAITWYEGRSERDFDFLVIGPKGNKVPLTEHG